LSSAAFFALAAAAWRSMKSGCLNPAIYVNSIILPVGHSTCRPVSARANRRPLLRLGFRFQHCATHRYSIGTKMG
jgi:hypothetical protein